MQTTTIQNTDHSVVLVIKAIINIISVTVSLNNIMWWTVKFKAQLTNGFFASIIQMFGGSCQLLTTVEHCFVV